MTTWSSASRMRSRPLTSGMLACPAEACRRRRDRRHGCGGHSYEDRRSVTGCGLDLQRGADERGAFLHAQQTEPAPIRIDPGRIESYAIILHDQRHVIGPSLENDLDVAGTRVLGDVVE